MICTDLKLDEKTTFKWREWLSIRRKLITREHYYTFLDDVIA